MLMDLTVKKFIDELASNSPAPGGGSVAALAASLAGALGSMVFNLTVGKKAYNEMDDEKKGLINDSLADTASIKDEFLSLMEKDTEEFMVLMGAFKMPKNTEEEKRARDEAINTGYVRAIGVPLEVSQKAYKLYDYILIASKYGNKNAVSDAGVAALLAQTAIEGAVLNVKINLSSLSDEKYRAQLQEECNQLILKGNARKNEILEIVNSKIG